MRPAEYLYGLQKFRSSLISCRFPKPLGTIQVFPAYDVKHSLRATPNTPTLGKRSHDH